MDSIYSSKSKYATNKLENEAQNKNVTINQYTVTPEGFKEQENTPGNESLQFSTPIVKVASQDTDEVMKSLTKQLMGSQSVQENKAAANKEAEYRQLLEITEKNDLASKSISELYQWANASLVCDKDSKNLFAEIVNQLRLLNSMNYGESVADGINKLRVAVDAYINNHKGFAFSKKGRCRNALCEVIKSPLFLKKVVTKSAKDYEDEIARVQHLHNEKFKTDRIDEIVDYKVQEASEVLKDIHEKINQQEAIYKNLAKRFEEKNGNEENDANALEEQEKLKKRKAYIDALKREERIYSIPYEMRTERKRVNKVDETSYKKSLSKLKQQKNLAANFDKVYDAYINGSENCFNTMSVSQLSIWAQMSLNADNDDLGQFAPIQSALDKLQIKLNSAEQGMDVVNEYNKLLKTVEAYQKGHSSSPYTRKGKMRKAFCDRLSSPKLKESIKSRIAENYGDRLLNTLESVKNAESDTEAKEQCVLDFLKSPEFESYLVKISKSLEKKIKSTGKNSGSDGTSGNNAKNLEAKYGKAADFIIKRFKLKAGMGKAEEKIRSLVINQIVKTEEQSDNIKILTKSKYGPERLNVYNSLKSNTKRRKENKESGDLFAQLKKEDYSYENFKYNKNFKNDLDLNEKDNKVFDINAEIKEELSESAPEIPDSIKSDIGKLRLIYGAEAMPGSDMENDEDMAKRDIVIAMSEKYIENYDYEKLSDISYFINHTAEYLRYKEMGIVLDELRGKYLDGYTQVEKRLSEKRKVVESYLTFVEKKVFIELGVDINKPQILINWNGKDEVIDDLRGEYEGLYGVYLTKKADFLNNSIEPDNYYEAPPKNKVLYSDMDAARDKYYEYPNEKDAERDSKELEEEDRENFNKAFFTDEFA